MEESCYAFFDFFLTALCRYLHEIRILGNTGSFDKHVQYLS
jgi:hypothetical protein